MIQAAGADKPETFFLEVTLDSKWTSRPLKTLFTPFPKKMFLISV